MQRLGLSEHVLMVTLDAESEAGISAMGVATIYRPLDGGNLGGLWVHRLRIVNELLADGLSLVHSDADAVWLADPLTDCRASGCDLLFTQGTIWPRQAHQKRGFVACCGCYFINYNPRSQNFMLDALEKCLELHDDQIAINLLLPKDASEWHAENTYTLTHKQLGFTASPSIMRAHSGELTFGILPHDRYPRLTHVITDLSVVKIAHPLSRKNARETIDCLKSEGLWFL